MKLKKMKHQLRGAFTVEAPRKRLRMWVGVPIMLGTSALGALYTTPKALEMAKDGSDWKGAVVLESPALVVGGVLTAIPYTRWAGGLVLGWALLGLLFSGLSAFPAYRAAEKAAGTTTTGALLGAILPVSVR